MKSGFDYREYKKWAESFGTVEKEFRKWLENFLLEEAQRVYDKAVTKQQTYSYTNSKGERKIGLIDTGTMIKSWYIKDVQWIGNSLQVEIGNNADYASYIEYGHHSFKGVFILTVAINDIQKQLPARFNQAWFKLLKSKGVV